MTLYRQRYMKIPIGIIPHNGILSNGKLFLSKKSMMRMKGYGRDRQSLTAEIYFMYLNSKRRAAKRPVIRFSGSSTAGELRIERKYAASSLLHFPRLISLYLRKVDGVCGETGKLYEFHGCENSLHHRER